MKPSAKKGRSKKKTVKKTRKELRKEKRQTKKAIKHEFFSRKKNVKQEVNKNNEELGGNQKTNDPKPKKTPEQMEKDKVKKAAAKKRKLEKEMHRVRVRQLKAANLTEDKLIKKLEKDLKLNKRKSKSVPKSFAIDGLDYLLEACDSEKLAEMAAAENNLHESGSEFEEDFAIATGKKRTRSVESSNGDKDGDMNDDKDGDMNDDMNDDVSDGFSDDFRDDPSIESDQEPIIKKLKSKVEIIPPQPVDVEELRESTEEEKVEEGAIWEDIYGRSRSQSGAVLPSSKYVPPQLRADNNNKSLLRLKAQMKGLLNRLAENNMKSIADQIENLYMSNSRHDTSETLTNLLIDALIGPIITPNRLVAEHVMLVVILHANVGTEVGAHFLQAIVSKYSIISSGQPLVEDKHLDNLLLVISHLYSFKVFSSELVYDILNQLAEKFGEKEVEILLLVLKTIGASLRKDNPTALKELIIRLQEKAEKTIKPPQADGTRAKFMMDILLAIKNNNMSKIPNYDPSHSEHLKKLLKAFLRPGNYVSELKISLQDLLKADVQGRWWVVGSAWTGSVESKPQSTNTTRSTNFSAQVLALAKKQRMNTEVRRNIFCVVITAEDYLDAFEKLLHLGLKNQQEQEIVHVVVDCCLQEKQFNPYYFHLLHKFQVFDRKYQMAIQYLMWDKFKELANMSKLQLANLAKLLTHLFLEPQGLALSVLKVISFAEVDKPTVSLLRQSLIGLLLAECEEACRAAFIRVAKVEKLRLFREGLRLFLHHFVLRSTKNLPPENVALLEERTKMADKALTSTQSVTMF